MNKNKRAFIAISYKNSRRLAAEIDIIVKTLREFGLESVVFVQKYYFSSSQSKEMMDKALKEIRSCDFLIAEVSEKAIGVGIEIGYAYGLGKPVIYVRKKGVEYSKTVGGLASGEVIYDNLKQLKANLAKIIQNLNL